MCMCVFVCVWLGGEVVSDFSLEKPKKIIGR